jgi:hypothetical protein
MAAGPASVEASARRSTASGIAVWIASLLRLFDNEKLESTSQARQLTNLDQVAKKRFAKSGQILSGGDGGREGLASIFIRKGT